MELDVCVGLIAAAELDVTEFVGRLLSAALKRLGDTRNQMKTQIFPCRMRVPQTRRETLANLFQM